MPYKMIHAIESEQEERRMSDLSDWASSSGISAAEFQVMEDPKTLFTPGISHWSSDRLVDIHQYLNFDLIVNWFLNFIESILWSTNVQVSILNDYSSTN